MLGVICAGFLFVLGITQSSRFPQDICTYGYLSVLQKRVQSLKCALGLFTFKIAKFKDF